MATGAEAWGFRGAVWTRRRVAQVIYEQFGVRYHPRHIGRLLAQLGWTVQKPVVQATQRDEAAIAAWVTQEWPALKKAARQGRTIVWVDEEGFYLLAGCVRTYAPRGQTPLLAVPLTRDHLEVIAGLTRSGRLLIHIQDHSYKGPDVVRFLRHLLGQIPERLLVIWDGSAIHWEGAVPAFLAARGAARLELVQLPGYAPELNPVEGIWQHLKTVELGNGCCRDQGVLRNQLRLAIARLWQKPEVIQGCIRHAGY